MKRELNASIIFFNNRASIINSKTMVLLSFFSSNKSGTIHTHFASEWVLYTDK